MNKHKLADFIKGYSILNGVCWVILFFFMLGNPIVAIFALAAGILVSVGMYTIGEVLQILHEIRNNTAGNTAVAPTGKTTVVNSQLPKL